MQTLIDLRRGESRRGRIPKDELPPWEPGTSAFRVLRFLRDYRYLTSELAGILYEAHHGRGRYQVRNQLTLLERYGYAKRHRRPAEVGSNQYVYTLSVEGGHLVIDDKDWSAERRKVYNRATTKSDYEHALAVTFLQILWDLGSREHEDLFSTELYWSDKHGDDREITNAFEATVEGDPVRIHPDTTVLIRHGRRDYVRPIFFEIERSRKNDERTAKRFRAYADLVTGGRKAVDGVFQRHMGLRPEPGMVVFIAGDSDHAAQLWKLARRLLEVDRVGHRKLPEFWFTSLDELIEEETETVDVGTSRSGVPRRRTRMTRRIIPPPAFFAEELFVNLHGKRGRLVV